MDSKIMKKILVVSKYGCSGKTTLVEKLTGEKLAWEERRIGKWINCNSAQWCCGDTEYAFTEIDNVFKEDREFWPEVEQMLMDAHAILFVHPHPMKMTLDDWDDFVEEMDDRHDNGYTKEVRPKMFFVMTFKDKEPGEQMWYEATTTEQRDGVEQKRTAEDSGDSFCDGWIQDFYLCLVLWLSNNITNDNLIFETSLKPDKGFDKLRTKFLEFLRDSKSR